MAMKSFIAADMRTALRLVREEFGEDAVILSNKRVPQGIELVAATEMPPAAPPRSEPQQQPEMSAPQAESFAFDETPRERRAAPDSGWLQMQQEMRAMRELIAQQYTNFSWQQYRSQQPAQAAMWRRLQRLGLDAAVTRDLLDGAVQSEEANANEAWQGLMNKLSARVAVCDGDLIAQGGTFAFIGPTGAGKTTTIGKLAARYVLDNGNADIALVTMDSYRIGAHEQLRTLSRILNIPCKIVSAQRDLGAVLYELRHCKLILIDSAGLNTKAPEFRQQVEALDALGDRVRCIQVLAANCQHQAMRAAQRAYRTGNLAGCILTKIDEAGSLGESVSALIAGGLPLAYTTDGQAIPGDIAVGNGKALVGKAIALAKQNECNEDEIAQAFATQREKALSA
ncbi:MAG: flagellar biosynthesis protein FlhF [Verrucomicrobiaceae bacterium]|nr:flagellar biosynthesis protein FlhF [Verrucomicrobiaceae bacterium]